MKAALDIQIRQAHISDALSASKVPIFSTEDQQLKYYKLLKAELDYCDKNPELRKYFLASQSNQTIAFAGARSYNQDQDENMYDTLELLPSGWYLRGIYVKSDFQRQGIAKKLTEARINWLKNKSNSCFVFLDDENKVSLPMYFEFGFKEVSRGWTFCAEERIKKGTRGILLRMDF